MRELKEKAITNRLEKYFNTHYISFENIEKREIDDYHVLKFAVPEKIITLTCDNFGNITVKERKRKQTKDNFKHPDTKNAVLFKKQKFKEGDIVQNIFSKNSYLVLSVEDNIVKLKEKDTAGVYLMADSDLRTV